MRFAGTAYRAHDPRWSFVPLSGAGAAVRGGRFNPAGVEALYLSLDVVTAVKEANQGLVARIDPCVLCTYEVDCDDIEDLSTEAGRAAAGVEAADLGGAWLALAAAGRQPPSWDVARWLIKLGRAGAIVPSFAPGAQANDRNIVLWRWSADLPHRVRVFDPSGRLPRNQLSWS